MATISFGDYNNADFSSASQALVKSISDVLNEPKNNQFLTKLSAKLHASGAASQVAKKYGPDVVDLAAFNPTFTSSQTLDPYSTCNGLFQLYKAVSAERTAWEVNARTAEKPLLNEAELTQFRQILDGIKLGISKPECQSRLGDAILEQYNSDVGTGRKM
jgi:hypothetical protein